MKQTNYMLALLVSAFALFASSCEETTPEVLDKAAVGSITMTKTSPIATGAPVTFTMPITTNDVTYAIDEALWYPSETSVGYPEEIINNATTFTYAWSTSGSYKVTGKYSYSFGVESFSKSTSIDIEVKQSHIGNSFLGATRSEVATDNTGLVEYSDNIVYNVSNNVTYFFTFADDILDCGQTLEYKTPAFTSAASYAAYSYLIYEYNNNAQNKLDAESIVYSVIYASGYTPTAEVAAAVAKFIAGESLTGTDEATTIGTAVVNAEIVSLCMTADIIDDSSVSHTIYVSIKDAGVSKFMVTTKTINK
ncbi:MAG: hypothetical protein R3Y22_03540 [Bacteroidales bacterium]